MLGRTTDQPGAIVVVVGPSGAGKDSVIGFVARHFEGHDDIDFVRRVITRPSDAGGEDHESVSGEDFDTRLAAEDFAVAWQAHGLKYGIPRQALDRVRAGRILIANGSRAALGQFRQVFPRVAVVNITASPQVLASRLVARGRESEQDILNRLQRQVPDIFEEPDVTTIDNSGPLDVAGMRFATLVAGLQGMSSEAVQG
ncbi:MULTISPECIES: phosphonate metabolism protein/1,5-bisphosphokinase (PRPP-forming) PhnN [unclassified Rhizobium]|uniref:phosphonate metabolism protein/1,5-bisphosphokinase (PRPP-forming) PhnN n=1 Tax=unclassified Rhizobium TaxID=2613769 RepID=UPI0007126D78|nr:MULTISPECIES: phosphonate metabolism protein/1,5-bisphosphokinase (PRPP-forming) PhnN [unclassified Rhizobium]KQS87641.1 ribose-phosphate pyrophosphokinase [Rhizobium sp. Leaf391]KQT07077.1 ribose-phosphate pyrophosphokinase [Rhizobium sp. Leaf386]KQT95203.1 ribose-phosphate pyrophosphokinase [Rhizobium sp. Leaf453]